MESNCQSHSLEFIEVQKLFTHRFMNNDHIHTIIKVLEETVVRWKEPVVGGVARKKDPFQILIATILSLRTKDETTRTASNRLFDRATGPDEIINLGAETIAELIYPVGFYKNKATTIVEVSKKIVDEYNGYVPDEIDELVTFKGIGRKTANLVVTLGYDKPGICVDIHVHRISNRWGYVATKDPDNTERALRQKLPEQYWIRFNDLLVPYGQNLCKPVSPYCSRCPIFDYCERIGVERSR